MYSDIALGEHIDFALFFIVEIDIRKNSVLQQT